jgi:hypothetical protein
MGSVSAPVQTDQGTIAAVRLGMPLARVITSPGSDYGEQVIQAAHQIAQSLEQKSNSLRGGYRVSSVTAEARRIRAVVGLSSRAFPQIGSVPP